MILYFSATGNSEYVAGRIAAGLGDECVDLFDRIRSSDDAPLRSEGPLVVVAPTYAWRIPRVVASWLGRTPLEAGAGVSHLLTPRGTARHEQGRDPR